jgi:hypothetical protein
LYGCGSPDGIPTASRLIDYEFRYSLPEATEVTLVWGINDWQPVYSEGLPAGTQVKDGVMHTPMTKEGDAFVTRIPFSPGTTVNYGFLAGKATDEAEMVWDSKEEDSFVTSQESEVIEVVSTLELPASQEAGVLGEVFLVCGMMAGTWRQRPTPRTVVTDTDADTHVPRERVFTVGFFHLVNLDYGFLITKTSKILLTLKPMRRNQGHSLLPGAGRSRLSRK